MSRNLRDYTGTFIIVAGYACTGKGTVAKLLTDHCEKNNFPHIKVSSGDFFRMTSCMVYELGLEKDIEDNERDPAKLASLILPITNSTNWSLDANNQVTLKYRGKTITQDNPLIISDKVSKLINYFSGIDQIRFSIFDYVKGAVGQTIDSSLKAGLCVIYDTHFPKGEMPHEILMHLKSQNKLAIIQTFASNDNAFRILAELRTKSIHGRKVVSEEEIQEVIDNLKKRREKEKANGVCVDEEYVTQNFREAYFKIMNDPKDGLEGLDAQLITVKSLIEANFK